MPPPRPRATAQVLGAGVLLALVAGLGGGCTRDAEPAGPPSSPSPVALRVTTVAGGGGLDPASRTEAETAVGDVISAYVSDAFLGEFPRRDFVPAFESFTSQAARRAALDIDRLTAAPVQDATAVRASRLDTRVSLLVVGDQVVGATAAVRFAFEATMPDGATRPLTLRGRFLLAHEGEQWSVFGYDVASDNGGDAP